MKRQICVLTCLSLVAGLLLLSYKTRATLSVKGTSESTKQLLVSAYAKLPLSFEANMGQTDPQVKFLSYGPGSTLFLTSTEAVLVLRKLSKRTAQGRVNLITTPTKLQETEAVPPAVLRMKLLGANPVSQVVGLEELPGKSNYFMGKDPEKWRTNVPRYAKVRYEEVYPGIDVVYYGTDQRQLEYDFVVSPGADPKAIRLGLEGAKEFTLDDEGNLVLGLDGGEVTLKAPVTYQEIEGQKEFIASGYVLEENNQVTFELAAYDASKPLIIDPILSYSTYLGGSGFDAGASIAVDDSGNTYITGQTSSTDFPTTPAALDTTCGTDGNCNPDPDFGFTSQDTFVTKLNADGSVLIYSTYLGGSDRDEGNAIALDASGNAYVVGRTFSIDFPTVNAFQNTCNLNPFGFCWDAFVVKLNATGDSLLYSTYFGGSDDDSSDSIVVDASGNAYVAGMTNSTDFPTMNPIQSACNSCGAGFGGFDAFVTKFNAAGSALIYSTYLGGSNREEANGIAVDSGGNAYVTGDTSSSDFPTTVGAFDTDCGTDGLCNLDPTLFFIGPDAFVTKLNPDGSGLVYSTYLGGSGSDSGEGIAVDASGNAYVTGVADNSADFPTTAGAFQTSPASTLDAFITKLNADGSALVYSTYLGGSVVTGGGGGDDIGFAIAVDTSGNAYVTGSTASTDFPTANPIQAAKGGEGNDSDAFVTKLNPAGSALLFSTFLGGTDDDKGFGIIVDSEGKVYVIGDTSSAGFPTTDAVFQVNIGGGEDAFVAKFSGLIITLVPESLTFVDQSVGTTSDPQTLTLTNISGTPQTLTGIDVTGDFAETDTCGDPIASGGSCTISVTFTPTLEGARTGELTVTDDTGGISTVALTGNGLGPVVNLSAPSLTFADQVVGTTSTTQTVTLANTGDGVLNLTGLAVSGDFAETDDCGSSVASASSCTINVTFTPTATGERLGELTLNTNDPNSPHTIALSGTGTDLLISPAEGSATTATINAGQTATYQLVISPEGFAGSVSMSCTGAPAQATCSVTPSSVTLDGTNPATVEVRVSTTAPSMLGPPLGPQPGQPWLLWLVALAMLASLVQAVRRRRALAGFVAALLFVVLWSSCGEGAAPPSPIGGGGTPAGTYTLTVTATSDGITRNIPLTLTVN